MIKQFNPKDKIWWVTGNTRDTLIRKEWVGNRSKDALLKCLRKPLKKTLFSFFEYERPGEKPFLLSLFDLIKIGAVTDDVKNCSAHFKTRKKPLLNPG
jgi:hypothetical protein